MAEMEVKAILKGTKYRNWIRGEGGSVGRGSVNKKSEQTGGATPNFQNLPRLGRSILFL